MKVNLQYGSDADGALPKAVVDEVELLVGGSLGKRGSYFAEQYVVDGGRPGRTRDLWLGVARHARWRAPAGQRARGAVYASAAGRSRDVSRNAGPLRGLGSDRGRERVRVLRAENRARRRRSGDERRGWSATLAAVQGHEPGSGMPARGVDRALYVQHARANVVLSAYRYDGTRAVDGIDDRFWREGYGVRLERPRAQFDAVYRRDPAWRAAR